MRPKHQKSRLVKGGFVVLFFDMTGRGRFQRTHHQATMFKRVLMEAINSVGMA